MLDVTATVVTNLHLGLSDLLTILAIPSGTWWVWRSRYGLAKAAAVLHLRCRFLLDGRQKAAGGSLRHLTL